MNKLIGKKFTATIYDDDVEGLIQVEDDIIILCQDIHFGRSCEDKLGYKGSWALDDNVSDLKIEGKSINLDSIHYLSCCGIKFIEDSEFLNEMIDLHSGFFKIVRTDKELDCETFNNLKICYTPLK